MRINRALLGLLAAAGGLAAIAQSGSALAQDAAAALAQGTLCNPCVDPVIVSPPSFDSPSHFTLPDDLPGLATPEDLRRQGGFLLGETLQRLRLIDRRTDTAFGFETLTLLQAGPDDASARLAVSAPLVLETIVAAPRDSVWRALTTSAGLSAWLAPLAHVDLRIGGKLRLTYDARAGFESGSAVENEILAFDPQRMIAWRVTAPPQDSAFADAARTMWTVVYLDAAGEEATRVRIVANGLRADAAGEAARAFFERANAEALGRLEQRFGTPAAP